MNASMENVPCVGRGEWNGVPALSRDGGCNVWLIDGGSEAALVDVGMPEGVDDLLANIRRHIDLKKLRMILITHSHWDHIAALAELQKRLDVTVYCHAIAKETIEGHAGIYSPCYTPPVNIPARADELVRDGNIVRVGEIELNVIELPGHTPDGVGFTLQAGDGVACFTGDTAIGDQACAKGVIGWIDRSWNSRLMQHKTSLERLLAGNFAAMFAGHGEAIIGRDNVASSLENCLWRLGLFMNIPGLGTMTPVQM